MSNVESRSFDKYFGTGLFALMFILSACGASLSVVDEAVATAGPLKTSPVIVPPEYGVGQLAQECRADVLLTTDKNPTPPQPGDAILLYLGANESSCMTPEQYRTTVNANCTFQIVPSDATENQDSFSRRVNLNVASFRVLNELPSGALMLGNYKGYPSCSNRVDANDLLRAGGR